VGMLVDNSIVVIENIYRLRLEGMPAVEAAVEGAREVSGAIMASTITTACVFLPIVFTKGISRQLFVDMGLTIAYSLFASLIVALSLVPAMGSTILKNTESKETKILDKLTNGYERILRWTLNHKSPVIIFVILLLIVSGYMAYSMGTSFMPEMESPEMSLNIEIPEDSSFDDTVEIADTVLDRIAAIEDVETVGAFQDSSMMSGMSMGSSNQNSMSIYLILDENKKTSNEEIGQEIERSIEDLDLEVSINTSNMDMTAVGGSGIEVLVKGKEIDNLKDIALDISKTIEDIEGTTEVSNGLEDNSSEIRITVDKEKGMEKGLTVAQIFGELNSILSQDDSVTTLTISNRDFPVIVVDEQNQSIRRDNIEDIIIKNQEDEEVKIGDIVDAREEEG